MRGHGVHDLLGGGACHVRVATCRVGEDIDQKHHVRVGIGAQHEPGQRARFLFDMWAGGGNQAGDLVALSGFALKGMSPATFAMVRSSRGARVGRGETVWRGFVRS
jgi:hypothetical protein